MKRNIQSFILLFLSSFFSFSQNTWYQYNWGQEKKRDHDKFCDEALRFNQSYYRGNPSVGRQYIPFCHESVMYLYEDFKLGNIYSSLEGYEKYVKNVLEKLIGDTNLTGKIRIVFYRDLSMNASMSESGVLRLNIGMIAKLRNEAELAMILGHEIAHFINEDPAKMYARRKEATLKDGDWDVDWKVKPGWSWTGGGTGMAVYSRVKRNEWYSQAQEESADVASVNFIEKSSYSLKSACNLYRYFKREEIKHSLRFGQIEARLSSHPDPGARMQMVNDFSTEMHNTGRKNYMVDSVQFQKLKRICFMESVNVALMDNSLDQLMVMTFSRYLMEPEDQYNLAVLIESLRRFISISEKTQDYNKSFILYPYQSKRPEVLVNYSYLGEPIPSILNYLAKGFIDINKNDLEYIKAKDLVDQEITEFRTYSEAYDYFKGKAQENNIRIAEQYKYFGSQPDFLDVGSFAKLNDLFLTNDYLLRKENIPSGKMIIVSPFSAFALSRVNKLEDIRVTTDTFNIGFVRELKKLMPVKTAGMSEFSFSEQRVIQNLIDLCHSELTTNSEETTISHSNVNWPEIYPELYSVFAKNKISDIYFCVPIRSSTKALAAEEIELVFYKISIPSWTTDKAPMLGRGSAWTVYNLQDHVGFSKKINKELISFMEKAN